MSTDERFYTQRPTENDLQAEHARITAEGRHVSRQEIVYAPYKTMPNHWAILTESTSTHTPAWMRHSMPP